MTSREVAPWAIGRMPLYAAAMTFALDPQAAQAQQLVADFSSLSIEDLANIEITSVSKTAEPLSEAAAAIYVITNDEIRRSGAVAIPEMLRLAPNLQVASINANSYAVSARGFNSDIANKLLVLIDGRSVYTPLYSGVFWNSQDIMPESIDRIEVISGPGGTLWGANAVNGVINIVTRDARDTQGFLVNAGAGTFNENIGAQYGGMIDDNTAYRVYGKGFRRGPSLTASGAKANDKWESIQGGFRMDWDRADGKITLQGDIYDGSLPQTATVDRAIHGHNLLARWNRGLGDGDIQVQAYYDTHTQSIPNSTADSVDTYDLEAQHSFSLGERHAMVWGGGYRIVRDDFRNVGAAAITPASRHLDLGSVFAENRFSLRDDLKLTVGLKLEHNIYTGFEYLPSARLAWQIDDATLLWSSVSRVVRTPSRLDRDLIQPGVLDGGPAFKSEKLVAYEAGYRGQVFETTSVSISAYYNTYDDLRTLELSPGGGLPLTFANMMEGDTYGVEAWGNVQVREWWRLSLGLNLLHKDLKLKAGSRDIGGIAAAGNDPPHQAFLRSSMNLPHGLELDASLRAVDALPSPRVPAYAELDARLGWNVDEHVEVAISGTNLFDRHHPETALGASRELRRAIYVSATWTP